VESKKKEENEKNNFFLIHLSKIRIFFVLDGEWWEKYTGRKCGKTAKFSSHLVVQIVQNCPICPIYSVCFGVNVTHLDFCTLTDLTMARTGLKYTIYSK